MRSRSNTASSYKGRKQRAQSRASTTSIHSGITQTEHQMPDGHYMGQMYDTNPHQMQQHSQHRYQSIEQMAPEDINIYQSAQQLRNPRDYASIIDPALGGLPHHSHGLQYPANAGHQMPMEGSFLEEDSQMLDGRSEEQEDAESVAGANVPAKKPSKSSAANELEMRQLFHANKDKSLTEIAKQLQVNERGPNSERHRQVFAMLWIDEVCSTGKGSVPRGRVYANYVSRCATERVTVLNPASFGKLVRVLFPGLKTRRLGMRKQSKYHYVNFSLKEDQPDLVHTAQLAQPAISFNDSASMNNMSNHASMPVDRAAFPSLNQQREPVVRNPRAEVMSYSVYEYSKVGGGHDTEASFSKVAQPLRFSASLDNTPPEYEPISLPKVDPFVPPGTDSDAASALTALYRSHCTSLIDAVRFCKERTFFHCFMSFHGTLTMPVQKLFSNPNISPWVEQCDIVMYQRMMRVLAPIILQAAPKAVLDFIRNITDRLVIHIQNSFNGQPSHVIQAKVGPATLFAGLLDRELRVNLTAHAAANMLTNPTNRDLMYEDWIKMVRPRKIAECVPTRGMDDVVLLLVQEMRDLLDPVAVSWDVEAGTVYAEIAMRGGRNDLNHECSSENILDKWVALLNSLPERFSYASAANIVSYVQSVGTAILRDITLGGGQSFGAWWVTKCWLDEMVAFMAEQGGFMEYRSPSYDRYLSRPLAVTKPAPNLGRELAGVQHNDSVGQAGSTHDDSGISLRTSDDEFANAKFAYLDAGHQNGNVSPALSRMNPVALEQA